MTISIEKDCFCKKEINVDTIRITESVANRDLLATEKTIGFRYEYPEVDGSEYVTLYLGKDSILNL